MHLVLRWIGRGAVVYCRRPPDLLVLTNSPALMTCIDCQRAWAAEPEN